VQPGAPSGAVRDLPVHVVAVHALVDESVRGALAARGLDPVVSDAEPRQRTARARVGLLLVHHAVDVPDAARVVSEHLAIPWLVVAPEERGPAWGAFYASGATLVVGPSVCLDDICGLLDDLAADRRPRTPRGRRELIRQWRERVRLNEEVDDRLRSLTTREREVLRELYAGAGVSDIAARSEVAEATVRTQVKAILRKLGVSSQLAAVAKFARSRLVDQR
jgi:DNA-binding NarL/FixJ family response regulator